MFQPRPLLRTIDAALRDLQDPKPAVRRSAVADLARLVDTADRERAVSGLVAALRTDGDPAVRANAAVALADGAVGTSLDDLIDAAKDSDVRVQQMAVLALGELSPKGHVAAQNAVAAALVAERPELRFQALIAARRLGFGDIEGLLRKALTDQDEKVRYLSLRLLEEHRAQKSALEPQTRSVVLHCLEDAVDAVRVAAAMLLAPEGLERARELLAEAINLAIRLPAPEDEQALLEMAGELRVHPAIPGLRRHRSGRFGLVPGRFAWHARVALARLGEEQAIREIQRGLRAWSRDSRSLAVAAAGLAGLKQARPVLEELARTDAADADALSEALGRLRE